VTAPLDLYLIDHLTAATGGVRLAERARDQHHGRDDELHRLLSTLTEEIRDDRAELRRMVDRVGATPDPVKLVAAVAGELVGRLKLNGRLVRRSPLSSLVELEGLAIALRGKRCGWTALEAAGDERLADFDFAALIRRADDQYERVEAARLRVAADVLPRSDV
jgi:hypothetical protein